MRKTFMYTVHGTQKVTVTEHKGHKLHNFVTDMWHINNITNLHCYVAVTWSVVSQCLINEWEIVSHLWCTCNPNVPWPITFGYVIVM